MTRKNAWTYVNRGDPEDFEGPSDDPYQRVAFWSFDLTLNLPLYVFDDQGTGRYKWILAEEEGLGEGFIEAPTLSRALRMARHAAALALEQAAIRLRKASDLPIELPGSRKGYHDLSGLPVGMQDELLRMAAVNPETKFPDGGSEIG